MIKYRSYKKNTKDYPLNRENPFMSHVIKENSVEILRRRKKYYLQDNREFTKVYAGFWEIIPSLTTWELKVFLYFMSRLGYCRDYVYFNKIECLRFCNSSNSQMVETAITGLLDKKILARGEHNHFFWLNIGLLIKGSMLGPTMRHLNGYSHEEIASSGLIEDTPYTETVYLPEPEFKEEAKQETQEVKQSKYQVYKDIQGALGIEESIPEYLTPIPSPIMIVNPPEQSDSESPKKDNFEQYNDINLF